MLTERQAAILGLVVDEYVHTAVPVSSKALVERHDLRVSPATIRNEFARLEDDGYITHPHTSAGRVPSDLGYRAYVESLMEEIDVGPEEQRTIAHQFHQATGLAEWLSLAATVLSSAVGNLAVITRPRRRETHLRHVQFVHLHDANVLVVAVVDDGSIRQRLVTLLEPTRQEDLTKRAERLNHVLAECSADRVRAVAAELVDPDSERLASHVAELLDELSGTDDTFVYGIHDVLAQPEFASPDRMLEAVRRLEAYELRQVLPDATRVQRGALHVRIGSENSVEWLHGWSVVIAGYGAADGASGTVAVIGPSRMQYARTIPRVRYLAALMSTVLHEAGA